MALFTDKSAPRAFPWLWYVRFAQIFLSLVALALAAKTASAIVGIDGGNCRVPSRTAFNIACAVISLLVMVYFILATGPTNVFKILPWLIWIQLGLDAFLFIFWLTAAATPLNCPDFCRACPLDFGADVPLYYVIYDNLFCYCELVPNFTKRAAFANRPTSTRKTGFLAARKAMNALMVVVCACTLAATIFWIFTERRGARGTAASTTQPPPPHPEAGVSMNSVQPTSTAIPDQKAQEGQHYAGQVQPQPYFNQGQPQPYGNPGYQQPQAPVYNQSIPQPQPQPQAQAPYEAPSQRY